MTLDEAIQLYTQRAENHEYILHSGEFIGEEGEHMKQDIKCCVSENRQLAEWLTELKEAKRLLKAVAKIVKNLPCDDDNCGECVHNDNGYVCSEYECFEWRYTNEALALIGEEGDTE